MLYCTVTYSCSSSQYCFPTTRTKYAV